MGSGAVWGYLKTSEVSFAKTSEASFVKKGRASFQVACLLFSVWVGREYPVSGFQVALEQPAAVEVAQEFAEFFLRVADGVGVLALQCALELHYGAADGLALLAEVFFRRLPFSSR